MEKFGFAMVCDLLFGAHIDSHWSHKFTNDTLAKEDKSIGTDDNDHIVIYQGDKIVGSFLLTSEDWLRDDWRFANKDKAVKYL